MDKLSRLFTKLRYTLSGHDSRYHSRRDERRAELHAIENQEGSVTQITFSTRLQYFNPGREWKSLMDGAYRLPWPTTPSYHVRVTVRWRRGRFLIHDIKVKGVTPWGMAFDWKGRGELREEKLCGLRKHLGKHASTVDDIERVLDHIYETTRVTPHLPNIRYNNVHLVPLMPVLIPLWWLLIILPQACYQGYQNYKKRRQRQEEIWEV